MTQGQTSSMKVRDWLADRPFTLAMSSGFFGFFAHCGVLSVFEEEGIIPSRVVGSSAGALIAGLWASGLSTEFIRDQLLQLERRDFWDPRPGLGLLRGQLFEQRLQRYFPVQQMESCRVPVAVSVFDMKSLKTRVLDRGCLATAVRASCAVPLLFHPVIVDGRPALDGGIRDRPGMDGLPNGERIFYHHLLPQSFWRRKQAPSSQVPNRQNMQSFAIRGLPQVHPFALHRGQEAFARARQAAQRVLEMPAGAHVEI